MKKLAFVCAAFCLFSVFPVFSADVPVEYFSGQTNIVNGDSREVLIEITEPSADIYGFLIQAEQDLPLGKLLEAGSAIVATSSGQWVAVLLENPKETLLFQIEGNQGDELDFPIFWGDSDSDISIFPVFGISLIHGSPEKHQPLNSLEAITNGNSKVIPGTCNPGNCPPGSHGCSVSCPTGWPAYCSTQCAPPYFACCGCDIAYGAACCKCLPL